MTKIIRVPVKEAEIVRLRIIEDGKLDPERKIKVIDADERFLEIPVTDDIEGFETYQQEDALFYNKWRSLKEILNGSIKENELEMLPSGWQILGEIIVVTIDPAIEHLKLRVAEALLQMYPYCNTVVRDLGISGQFRLPEREILIGNSTETINKENGCFFKLDVTKVMFSKGNLHEKALMSRIGKHETIVDMFAGIGYFTIPMAVHAKPARIIAIEINPQSYAYLRENITLNHVENIVEAKNGDCAELTPEGIADRVIMGYVGTTHHYLEQGIKALKESGGILHYHETTPESLIFSRPISRIEHAASEIGRHVEIMDCRKIKKYSPGIWHVVVDARIS
ncbi:class I SAM-dependent methyltransferase family protein [Methanolobus mangrovi]|uniref:tRNA(Phe) (4-demethylwyosine(37)-C(7)) aminocarboxypropyltransferase n=1 Tax=Methanolobus mangrovi TaxID=3072977 RepID=A0AA51UJZ6_9EURY|nr:class I SAM-dependent methyltransferase family protein [Methanolobus mangrovi]WMW23096.1 class I SAM-dependent methyltransferase family protein [Methanolobus mangrovi]